MFTFRLSDKEVDSLKSQLQTSNQERDAFAKEKILLEYQKIDLDAKLEQVSKDHESEKQGLMEKLTVSLLLKSTSGGVAGGAGGAAAPPGFWMGSKKILGKTTEFRKKTLMRTHCPFASEPSIFQCTLQKSPHLIFVLA